LFYAKVRMDTTGCGWLGASQIINGYMMPISIYPISDKGYCYYHQCYYYFSYHLLILSNILSWCPREESNL
jgi:hypothetical protein